MLEYIDYIKYAVGSALIMLAFCIVFNGIRTSKPSTTMIGMGIGILGGACFR